jgi:transposase-like protein
MGILERGGNVRTQVIGSRKEKVLQEIVKQHVEAGAEVFTDALKSYEGLDAEFVHRFVDHYRIRQRSRPHERHGELLEPLEAEL